MKDLKEKVAYLKGLAEGMELDDSTNEVKLLKAVIHVMDDLALAVDDIEEIQEELGYQVDEIDEDLGEIESLLYEDSDEKDEAHEEDKLINCPHCGESFELDPDSIKDDQIDCPICSKAIDIVWQCDCEDCKEEEQEQQ